MRVWGGGYSLTAARYCTIPEFLEPLDRRDLVRAQIKGPQWAQRLEVPHSSDVIHRRVERNDVPLLADLPFSLVDLDQRAHPGLGKPAQGLHLAQMQVKFVQLYGVVRLKPPRRWERLGRDLPGLRF